MLRSAAMRIRDNSSAPLQMWLKDRAPDYSVHDMIEVGRSSGHARSARSSRCYTSRYPAPVHRKPPREGAHAHAATSIPLADGARLCADSAIIGGACAVG